MGPTLDAIVTALDAHKVGSEWKALCPCHDDHNPSLSITEKNGKPVVMARALIDLLVLVAPSDPQKEDAILLCDKTASEFFERFSRNLV